MKNGGHKVSNAELNSVANDIYNVLRSFDSPRDAGAVVVLAYIKVLQAAFPPEETGAAVALVKDNSALIIKTLQEGWQ